MPREDGNRYTSASVTGRARLNGAVPRPDAWDRIDDARLPHQKLGSLTDPVDHLRADKHMLIGVPSEVERVRQPVHDIEDEIDVKGSVECLVGYARGTYRLDIGRTDEFGTARLRASVRILLAGRDGRDPSGSVMLD